MMARIVKEEEYAVRRNEILDVTQRLVYTKGFEQMSIQDILDELKISRGAFYHYFDSKSALLEAMTQRLIDEAEKVLKPVFDDPGLNAVEKLQRYFATAAIWKTTQKTYLLAILRSWYSDDNAIVRQKMTIAGLDWIAPMLTPVICQGIQEGIFKTDYPDLSVKVIMSVMQGLSESFAGILLGDLPDLEKISKMENLMAAYTDAMERVLGAPAGSIQFLPPKILEEWVV
jgi:TetR/AcrR family transcriptional regulator, transcriptional repressor for nem operon